MWTRKQLKENAKSVLSKYDWTAFAVSFVLSLVGGSTSGGSFSSFSRIDSDTAEVINDIDKLDAEQLAVIFGICPVCCGSRFRCWRQGIVFFGRIF